MNTLILFFLLAPGGVDDTPASSVQNVLGHTAQAVQRFWDEFVSVNCTESVVQEKLGKEGKVQYERRSIYDYLIIMNLQGDDLSVEESRLLQKESGKPNSFPLLLTSGFSTLQLIFHPFYQAGFEYRRLDDETVAGRRLLRLEFHHVPGMRSTSAVRLRGKDYPLDLAGTAWINPESWAIEKITARLEQPMEDLNLRSLSTEVRYASQRFPPEDQPEWLPAQAAIDVETTRQHWRNVHSFSNYRRFTVKTETSVQK